MKFVDAGIWMCLILLAIPFIVYPFFLILLSLLRKRKDTLGTECPLPAVSMIIPARNEELVIADKIQNTLELNYPRELLEIIVISDGSTDDTFRKAKSFKSRGIHLLESLHPIGKTACQNLAVKVSKGSILVFSDANAIYHREALRELIKPFQDPDVGCVSGQLLYQNADAKDVLEETFYWRHEKGLRSLEGRVGNILGANGSIYAVRRSDYIFLDEEDISDLIQPLEIFAGGKKVRYAPEALSYETSAGTIDLEFSRRRRIVSRSIRGLVRHAHLMNPMKYGALAFQLLMHKWMRWFTPVFVFCLWLLVNFAALSGRWIWLGVLQWGFLLWALVGLVLRRNKQLPSWIFGSYYVCLLGAASIAGIVDALRGKAVKVWEPRRFKRPESI